MARPIPPPRLSARLGYSSTSTGWPAAIERCMAAPAIHADADHPDIRLDGLRGQHDPGRQPAARKRHQQHVEIGARLQHLQPDRALAGDHQRIVEGRDLGQPLLGHQSLRLGLGVVLALAGDPHLGTKCADALDLHPGHQRRHADHRADAARPCRVGHAAAMIAGRAAGDAGRVRGQGGHGVHRAAQLEGADGLHVLELEQEILPGNAGHVGRGHHRGRVGDAADSPSRGKDIGQCQGHGACLSRCLSRATMFPVPHGCKACAAAAIWPGAADRPAGCRGWAIGAVPHRPRSGQRPHGRGRRTTQGEDDEGTATGWW